MSIPKSITSIHPPLSRWAILMGYRGSIAHGMYVPHSDPNSVDDKDVTAVCVPTVDWYFGVPTETTHFPSNGTQEIKRDEWDIVAYEARKFIFLLAQGNPNVLTLLWLKNKNYILIQPAGQLILDNRQLFVGRHVYKSFTGYAYSQLHRMTDHTFEGFMGAKRKALVDKYGYDCKNAAHLIRLLRMGIEFLKDGELYVEREDASQLLDIKLGKWTLEQVKSEADRLFKLADETYVRSTLPKAPNMENVYRLSVEVINQSRQ